MDAEHPFAPYVRILGRGPGRSRALTQVEARDAMRMIANGDVEPVQLGAFLMLLRYRQETAVDLAGFVEALREGMTLPAPLPRIDLDWPTYAAGRTRGAPWYLLSALLLAENGVRIVMHGPGGASSPVVRALAPLGISPSTTPGAAAGVLRSGGFAFMPLAAFCPALVHLLGLRRVLGLRSAANSVARLLNPFNAPGVIQGVFHPGYRELQRNAAMLLDQQRLAVFKGGGGEAERNPDKPCRIALLEDGRPVDEEWAPRPASASDAEDADENADALLSCWRRDANMPGRRIVVATAAVALRVAGRAGSMHDAEALAEDLWRRRFRRRSAAAAIALASGL